jgi:hypothetical protein
MRYWYEIVHHEEPFRVGSRKALQEHADAMRKILTDMSLEYSFYFFQNCNTL